MHIKHAAAILSILSLSACSRAPVRPSPQPIPAPIPQPPQTSIPPAPQTPRAEPRSRGGNPPFYEVFGKRYFVMSTSAGYAERGVASWYGPDFHGGKTSNGEKYDMHAMTAAHKTLPLPTWVQVTNLKNGKSVTLRVNDRGPFVGNRLIDLSFAAAKELDVVRAGTALVEVRALDFSAPISRTPAQAQVQTSAAPAPVPPPDALYVQAGAYGEQTNADRLVERLKAGGVSNAATRREIVNGKPLYRVRVGPVPSVAEFDRLVKKLKDAGIADARLALD